MKRILTTIQKEANKILMATVLAGAMTSCDSVLGYPDEDCSIEYRVKFKYDYNMDGVDKFAANVKTVALYAFDDNGKLAYFKTEEGEMLADGNYSMKLDINDQQHHLIVWAGLDDQSFAVPVLTPGLSDIKDLTVKMLRKNNSNSRATSEEGMYIVEDSLSSLWHGEVEKSNFTRVWKEKIQTVSLIKNTNLIHISVAQVGNDKTRTATTRTIDKNTLSCTLYDQNGFMNYNNSLLEDNLLTYRPYEVKEGEVTTRAFTPIATEYPAVTADLSVGRLVEENTPRINIKNNLTGEALINNGNLMGYIKQTWEEHYKSKMGFQEYLDREDEFYITFFVDEKMALIKTVIQINEWIIQINDFEL